MRNGTTIYIVNCKYIICKIRKYDKHMTKPMTIKTYDMNKCHNRFCNNAFMNAKKCILIYENDAVCLKAGSTLKIFVSDCLRGKNSL